LRSRLAKETPMRARASGILRRRLVTVATRKAFTMKGRDMERLLKTLQYEMVAARNLNGTGTVEGIKAQRRHLQTAIEMIDQALDGTLPLRPMVPKEAKT
jgi:hypothetical protein